MAVGFQERYRRYCLAKWRDPEYYSEIDISMIDSPFTILLGPNGCGKSMSLRLMQQTLDNEKKKYLAYSNKNNDIVIHGSYFDPQLIAWAFASEGERIKGSIDYFNNGEFLNKILKSKDDLFIFLDEFDSGLSYDKLLNTIRTYIWIYIQEKAKNPERKLNFIFTCNSYEMLRCFRTNMDLVKCIWVPCKREVKIRTYEKFEELYQYYFDYMSREEAREIVGGKYDE